MRGTRVAKHTRSLWRRRPFALLLAGLLAAAAAYCILSAAQHAYYVSLDMGGTGEITPLLQHPERTAVAAMSNVTVPSRDGTPLSGWYVPTKNGAVVIVTAGTHANRIDMLPEITMLAGGGFGVLAFDWPGTGLSGGKVNWGVGATAALEGAIDWLAMRSEVKRIGALGFSMGGILTTQIAAVDERVRAVVLLATPPAIDQSSAWVHLSQHPLKQLPEEWVLRWYGFPVGRSRPIELVGKIAPRPVLIICGSDDVNSDAATCAKFFAAAGEPKAMWVVRTSTHGGYSQFEPVEYPRRVIDFLKSSLLDRSTAMPATQAMPATDAAPATEALPAT